MNNLQVIEHEKQRVLTTKQIAESYETSSQKISNNFNNNKKRYEEGKHYYKLEGTDVKQFITDHKFYDQSKNTTCMYLWTERGAMLHAKSLGTDKAWQMYEMLLDTYFKVQEMKEKGSIDLIQNLEKRLSAIENQNGYLIKIIANQSQMINNIQKEVSVVKYLQTSRNWKLDSRALTIRKKIDNIVKSYSLINREPIQNVWNFIYDKMHGYGLDVYTAKEKLETVTYIDAVIQRGWIEEMLDIVEFLLLTPENNDGR